MAIVRNSIRLGGGGTEITVVANYSALPDPTTVSGEFYWAEASQGTSWLPGGLGGTYYNSGMYYSNGVSWTFMNVPYNATLAEVNTGTNNDKFVTPSTLSNSTWSFTVAKVLATLLTGFSSSAGTVTSSDTILSAFNKVVGNIALSLLASNNLSDLASIATARVNLGVDKITNNGNSNYTILSTDKAVTTNANFTASRTWTLPLANSVNAGYEIIVADLFGGVTSTNTLVIARAGSDTINGATSVTIGAVNGMRRLISDGTSKWTFDAGVMRVSDYIGTTLTASKAVVTDVNSKLEPSATTATEIGYVSGVTSAIQTQIDGASKKLINDGALSSNLNSTTETILKSYTITGGKISTTDICDLSIQAIKSGTAGNMQVRAYLNNTSLTSLTNRILDQSSSATFISQRILRQLTFRGGNVLVSNVSAGGITDVAGFTSAQTSLTLNPANDCYLIITITAGSAVDTENIGAVRLTN